MRVDWTGPACVAQNVYVPGHVDEPTTTRIVELLHWPTISLSDIAELHVIDRLPVGQAVIHVKMRDGRQFQGGIVIIAGRHGVSPVLQFECIGADSNFAAYGYFDRKPGATFALPSYEIRGLSPATGADVQLALSAQKERVRQNIENRARLARAEQEAAQLAEARQSALLQLAEVRRNAFLARAREFRSTIKVGSETNCGPVLEIRADLAKVYSPVKDYGNEHWIRVDQLFPPLTGCRFLNGQYEPPQ